MHQIDHPGSNICRPKNTGMKKRRSSYNQQSPILALMGIYGWFVQCMFNILFLQFSHCFVLTTYYLVYPNCIKCSFRWVFGNSSLVVMIVCDCSAICHTKASCSLSNSEKISSSNKTGFSPILPSVKAISHFLSHNTPIRCSHREPYVAKSRHFAVSALCFVSREKSSLCGPTMVYPTMTSSFSY